MRIFIDCEFNDFEGDLISMALVSEDGREWYEVVPCDFPTDWVVIHIMPILNKTPVSISNMQRSLASWLSQFETLHVVADWPEDIKHFCNALITGPGTDLDIPPLTMEILKIIDAVSELPHNALADARGIRKAILDKDA
jgi:hypothetical protein